MGLSLLRRSIAVMVCALWMPLAAVAAGETVPVATSAAAPPPTAATAPGLPPAQPICPEETASSALTQKLAFPQPWEGLRQLFLDGKCALLQGNAKRAEAIFRQGLEQDKRLPTLWRFYLLRAELQGGKSVDALS